MEIYKAGPDVMKMVQDLIAKHHPHLVLIEDDIGVVFREKAREVAGFVIAGATKKAPPLLPVLTDKKFTYKFVIEIGQDAWQDLDNRQQMALLDHHLCAMKVEENADTGELKCSVRPYDFSGYKEEFERWGMWRPMDDETLSIIEKMFGKKAEEGGDAQASRASDDDIEDVMNALGGAPANS
jgi:hypothetical protein